MAVGITALALDVIGHFSALRTPSWCWIDPDIPNGIMWTYITGKGWEMASYVTVLALYMAVKVHLMKQIRKATKMRTFIGSISRDDAGRR